MYFRGRCNPEDRSLTLNEWLTRESLSGEGTSLTAASSRTATHTKTQVHSTVSQKLQRIT